VPYFDRVVLGMYHHMFHLLVLMPVLKLDLLVPNSTAPWCCRQGDNQNPSMTPLLVENAILVALSQPLMSLSLPIMFLWRLAV
jgi:hypothetical protein